MNKIQTTKGMTLVELLVAIFILSLTMVGFTILAAKTWKTKGYILEATSATTSASRVLTEVTHELRNVRQADDGSYPIKEVEDYSLIVYRNDDGDPLVERVHYFVEDGQLKKGVAKPVGGVYPNTEDVQVLLNYVTNVDNDKPLFYYYANNYPAVATGAMENPIPSDVRLVRMNLWVNIRPIVAPENVNLDAFAEMRNLNEF